MKVSEISVIRSSGFRLLNDIRLDTGLLPRGHVITEDDILMFQIMGLKKIQVVEIEKDEAELKTIQGIVSAKICGSNTAYGLSESNIVKVVASVDGHFLGDEKRIEKFNNIQKSIILNTIPCYSFVKSGEVLAKLDFSQPLYNLSEVETFITNLSGNYPLLAIEETRRRKVGLVYVEFYKDKQEKEYFTQTLSKLIKETKSLKLDFSGEYFVEYDSNSIANGIDDAYRDGKEAIILISGLKSTGQEDALYRGIKETSDEILTSYVDIAEATDLLISTKKRSRIIALPFNYAKVNSSFLTEMIFKAIIKEKIQETDFYVRNNIFEDKFEKISPAEEKNLIYASEKYGENEGDVAVVILAAGISARAGKDKLMQPYKGKPLFCNAVTEAVKSKVGPVFLVTGGKSAEMEEFVKHIDINVINNISYREGVKSSIRLGLNHIPNFCKGAIVLPADMPNITASHLKKMSDAFERNKEKQIVVTMYKNEKYNPVLWSKALFAVADIVPENSGIRPVLVEFEDLTQQVKVKNVQEVFDVTYPADIQKLK